MNWNVFLWSLATLLCVALSVLYVKDTLRKARVKNDRTAAWSVLINLQLFVWFIGVSLGSTGVEPVSTVGDALKVFTFGALFPQCLAYAGVALWESNRTELELAQKLLVRIVAALPVAVASTALWLLTSDEVFALPTFIALLVGELTYCSLVYGWRRAVLASRSTSPEDPTTPVG